MKSGRSRWLLRLGVVLIVGLLALLWAVTHRDRTLTIENRASQPIASLHVTIAGQTSHYRNVAPGATIEVDGNDSPDEFFTVEGELAGGTQIRFRGKLKERAEFLLLPNGELQPKPRPKGLFGT
jgi:hypothetical protein